MSHQESAGTFNKWFIVVILLAIIIIAAGIVFWVKSDPGQEFQIFSAPETPISGEIFVSGEVANPGIYPLKAGDTIDDLLAAAGGTQDTSAPLRLELAVNAPQVSDYPQQVDINRADLWLLAALPGIGEAKAQAIINYRSLHGRFRSIEELTKVEGIGEGILDRIRNMITVND